ncbi:hypothetical protein Q7A53_03060 [Halobacillus rhizosphaerae]|uniref:hypothetical protein n=1 Tax=Halobacillus rhizosphaerae TaxID=3064889 RepID=UPI00398B6F76
MAINQKIILGLFIGIMFFIGVFVGNLLFNNGIISVIAGFVFGLLARIVGQAVLKNST